MDLVSLDSSIFFPFSFSFQAPSLQSSVLGQDFRMNEKEFSGTYQPKTRGLRKSARTSSLFFFSNVAVVD